MTVKQNVALSLFGVVAIVLLTFIATQYLQIFLALIFFGILLGVFKIIDGLWRRTFVLTILAMTAGASHIAALAQIGSLAKILALAALIVVTAATTKSSSQVWASRLHRRTIGTLWLLVVLAGISIVWSESRFESLTQVATFAGFVYLLQRVSGTRWTNRAVMLGDLGLTYWTLVSVLSAGIALALVGFPEAISSFSGRWQGLFNNPNLLGMMAALTTSLGVGWALHKRSWIVWMSVIVPISQVMLSESRTAMIATATSLLWVFIRGKAKYVVVAAYSAVLVIVGARAFGVELNSESFNRFTAMEGGDLLNSRTSGWADAINYVSGHPLGIGWAATTDVLASYRTAGIGAGLSSVHNSYLQVIYELGWLGVIPVALVAVILIRVSFMRSDSGIAAGLIAMVLSGTIIQFTESAIFGVGQPYPYVFWFAVLACILLKSSENEDATPDSITVEVPRTVGLSQHM